MTDAPRWPGADGSPGLDFSGKSKPSTAVSPGDTTRITTQPFDRRGSAPDWKLDAITRSPASSAPSTARGGASAPASTATKPSAAKYPYSAEPVKPVNDKAAAGAVSADSKKADRKQNKPGPGARGVRRTRKARLRVQRIDPWSVMKTSLLFSIAFGVMLVAGVAVLWSVFASSDTMTQINDLVNSIIADPQGGQKFDIHQYLSWERVVGLTMLIAAIDALIFTAVATLFAFLYNLSAVIMGGLEIMFAED